MDVPTAIHPSHRVVVSTYYNRSFARSIPSQVIMAAVPKSLAKAPRLTVDYDRRNDVLYVLDGRPRPAEGEDLPGGIVRRYALDDNSPCGVTIIGYRCNQWPKKVRELAEIIADHLPADVDQVEQFLDAVTASTQAQVKS